MIIDAHAYCFPPLGEANGFPSAAEHLRYVQREMADHHQPVWRLRDRARVGDNSMLSDPDDGTLAGLKEVAFRSGGHGRFAWTVDGVPGATTIAPGAELQVRVTAPARIGETATVTIAAGEPGLERQAQWAVTATALTLTPAPAPLARLRGRYRVQLFLKGGRRREMREALLRILDEHPRLKRRVVVDVDPVSML